MASRKSTGNSKKAHSMPRDENTGQARENVPQQTEEVQSDDSNETEPLKRSRDNTPDLNGTSETDMTDQSPRSDGEEHSETIAVDCSAGPSEVIVQGKNVRKIRVKFPTHPPSSLEEQRPRPPSGRPRKRPSETNLEAKLQMSPTQEALPLSQEETPVSDHAQSSLWPSSISSNGSNVTSGVQNACADVLSQRSGFNYDFGLHVGNIDMDKKFRQDVLNGIEYFENRNEELKQVNNRMLREIDRLTALNAEMERKLRDVDCKMQMVCSENDELKIQLDEMQKENCRLQEQAVDHWQGRVKVEEMFSEMKRDSEQEIKHIREQALSKENETSADPSARKSEKKKEGSNTRSLGENSLELLRKVSHLQDQLTKIQMEKGLMHDTNKKLQKEVSDYKNMYKDKSRELDAHFKRFLSLKKSFNNLTDEHEKLKTILRGRSVASSTPGDGVGNSTWPSKNINLGLSRAKDFETVRLVDISAKVNGSSGPVAPSYSSCGQKTPKPVRSKVMTHKRDGLASIIPDQNLPPVPNVAK